MQVRGTAAIPNSIIETQDYNAFYAGIYSIDNKVVSSDLFGDMINFTAYAYDAAVSKDLESSGWIFKTDNPTDVGMLNSHFIKAPFYQESAQVIMEGDDFKIVINFTDPGLTAVYICGVTFMSFNDLSSSQEEHDKLSYIGNETGPMPIIFYRDSLALAIGDITGVIGYDKYTISNYNIRDALNVSLVVNSSDIGQLWEFAMQLTTTDSPIPFDIIGSIDTRHHVLYKNPLNA